MEYKKLTRTKTNRKIAGVCEGIGVYLDIDPVIIRVLFLLFIVFGGGSVLLYLVLWVIMPDNDEKTDTKQSKTTDTTPDNPDETNDMPKTESDSEDEMISPCPETSDNAEKQKRNLPAVLGICLIFTGLFFLIKNLVPAFWDFYLPILFIFLGLLCLIIPNISHRKK
jgi:phage shock protein PspC (stress-responsive transcriptional regulator)